MPRVRMVTSVADRNYSLADGEEADVPAELARRWVAAGLAAYVTGEPVEVPERRREPVERRRPGRARNP